MYKSQYIAVELAWVLLTQQFKSEIVVFGIPMCNTDVPKTAKVEITSQLLLICNTIRKKVGYSTLW